MSETYTRGLERMSATVKEVAALANVDKFMNDTGANGTYGECHNALTWLAVQIKKANISDYNIHLCTGAFAGRDHSWLEVQDMETEKQIIIDMTVDQFGEFTMPYVGPVSPGYAMHDCCCLCDTENIQQFVERLG